jgi:hypothetical protein
MEVFLPGFRGCFSPTPYYIHVRAMGRHRDQRIFLRHAAWHSNYKSENFQVLYILFYGSEFLRCTMRHPHRMVQNFSVVPRDEIQPIRPRKQVIYSRVLSTGADGAPLFQTFIYAFLKI